MNRDLHFSSATDEWPTPHELFDRLDAELGPFTLDAAATATNAKVPGSYYTREDDGLAQPWTGTVWCNPPYARGITERWIEKAIQSAHEGATVVMLLPARTDTRWFHACLDHADEVRLLRGRLRFGDAKDVAPFPSCVVVFRHRRERSWPAGQGLRYTMPKRHGVGRWVRIQLRPQYDDAGAP